MVHGIAKIKAMVVRMNIRVHSILCGEACLASSPNNIAASLCCLDRLVSRDILRQYAQLGWMDRSSRIGRF